MEELRIDPELDDRVNPRLTLPKLAFHFILPYLAVLAGGSELILWHRGTEGDSSSGGRHSPGTRAHGARTATQLWKGGSGASLY